MAKEYEPLTESTLNDFDVAEQFDILGKKIGNISKEYDRVMSLSDDEISSNQRYEKLESLRMYLRKTIAQLSERSVDLNADIEEEQEAIFGYDIRVEPLNLFKK